MGAQARHPIPARWAALLGLGHRHRQQQNHPAPAPDPGSPRSLLPADHHSAIMISSPETTAMVKVRSSLFGLKASGPLGADLTFSTHGKQVRAGRRPYPFNPQTSAQVSHRTLFLSGIEFWHTLTDAQKRVYAAINPRIGANPGYLNFMSLWLEGNVPYDRGEGHIYLDSLAFQAILQGVWGGFPDPTSLTGGKFANLVPADADKISYRAYLDAAIYTLRILAHQGPTSGIMDIRIDGTLVATFDHYAAGFIANVPRTQSGIVIAAPGKKTITLEVNGKNPLSTDFFLLYSFLAAWRTS